MSAASVTYRGVVYPAQTDAMGHMNTQFYVAAFDQAMWHLVAALGFRSEWIRERREGWADVKYVIDFKRELRAGDLYHIESVIHRLGRNSLVTRHVLVDTNGGEAAAELEMTSVYFDLEARASTPIPEEIRLAAQTMLGVASTG
jgi:acyl-CoA thioester hydrolase